MSKKAKTEIQNPEMVLSIPENEVIERVQVSEAIEVVRCKKCIYLHCNGFYLVSKPTLAMNHNGGALYETLNLVCDTLGETGKAEAEEDLKTFCQAAVLTLLLPLDLFADADFCLDIAGYIAKKRTELYKRLSEQAGIPSEDDPEKDEAFAETVKVAEEIAKHPRRKKQ